MTTLAQTLTQADILQTGTLLVIWTILGWIVVVFLGVRILIAFVNLLSRQWLEGPVQPSGELVSVMIPARNEEKNISWLLHDLLAQDHPMLEIMVYDDASDDHTSEIVEEMIESNGNVRLFKGTGLPPGWLGKNHACYQLAQKANGVFFLFLDADVRLSSGAISHALSHAKKHDLDMLSIFPSQIMLSWGEKISVPLMNWVLLSLLPLIMTRLSSFASMSAANGQFMFFRAGIYQSLQPHQRFRKQAVEDIAIARFLKTRQHRMQTLLGGQYVFCRMYGSLHEAMHGFSKNVLAFFGNSSLISLTFALFTTFGIVAVYIGLPPTWAPIYIAGILLLRTLVAICSRQPVIFQLITTPIQQLVFLRVVLQAVINRKKRTNTWKGRSIDI